MPWNLTPITEMWAIVDEAGAIHWSTGWNHTRPLVYERESSARRALASPRLREIRDQPGTSIRCIYRSTPNV